MIYYLIHNLINFLTTNLTEGKKNTFTFILGSTLHVLTYVWLEYYGKLKGNKFLVLLHSFYLYFVVSDVLTMVALYKLYWGRNIINEFDGSPDNWSFDEKNHNYRRKSQITEKQDPPKEINANQLSPDMLINSGNDSFTQMTSLNETQKQQIDDLLSMSQISSDNITTEKTNIDNNESNKIVTNSLILRTIIENLYHCNITEKDSEILTDLLKDKEITEVINCTKINLFDSFHSCIIDQSADNDLKNDLKPLGDIIFSALEQNKKVLVVDSIHNESSSALFVYLLTKYFDFNFDDACNLVKKQIRFDQFENDTFKQLLILSKNLDN